MFSWILDPLLFCFFSFIYWNLNYLLLLFCKNIDVLQFYDVVSFILSQFYIQTIIQHIHLFAWCFNLMVGGVSMYNFDWSHVSIIWTLFSIGEVCINQLQNYAYLLVFGAYMEMISVNCLCHQKVTKLCSFIWNVEANSSWFSLWRVHRACHILYAGVVAAINALHDSLPAPPSNSNEIDEGIGVTKSLLVMQLLEN